MLCFNKNYSLRIGRSLSLADIPEVENEILFLACKPYNLQGPNNRLYSFAGLICEKSYKKPSVNNYHAVCSNKGQLVSC